MLKIDLPTCENVYRNIENVSKMHLKSYAYLSTSIENVIVMIVWSVRLWPDGDLNAPKPQWNE